MMVRFDRAFLRSANAEGNAVCMLISRRYNAARLMREDDMSITVSMTF
jgi:hypothetical protein